MMTMPVSYEDGEERVKPGSSKALQAEKLANEMKKIGQALKQRGIDTALTNPKMASEFASYTPKLHVPTLKLNLAGRNMNGTKKDVKPPMQDETPPPPKNLVEKLDRFLLPELEVIAPKVPEPRPWFGPDASTPESAGRPPLLAALAASRVADIEGFHTADYTASRLTDASSSRAMDTSGKLLESAASRSLDTTGARAIESSNSRILDADMRSVSQARPSEAIAAHTDPATAAAAAVLKAPPDDDSCTTSNRPPHLTRVFPLDLSPFWPEGSTERGAVRPPELEHRPGAAARQLHSKQRVDAEAAVEAESHQQTSLTRRKHVQILEE